MVDKLSTHSTVRSKIGDVLSNTPLYKPLHRLYWEEIVPTQNRFRDIKAFRGLCQSGIVKIYSDVETLEPFYIYSNSSVMDKRRRRLRGVYEKPALKAVAKELDNEAIIWEVGGGHRQFSLAAAATGADAYAVEADETAAAAIRVGADTTGVNVRVFEKFVGGETGLDEPIADGEPPTVIILHVKGTNMNVLLTATQTLAESKPLVIVEVHHNALADQDHSVTDVENLFEEAGYSVKELFRR